MMIPEDEATKGALEDLRVGHRFREKDQDQEFVAEVTHLLDDGSVVTREASHGGKTLRRVYSDWEELNQRLRYDRVPGYWAVIEEFVLVMGCSSCGSDPTRQCFECGPQPVELQRIEAQGPVEVELLYPSNSEPSWPVEIGLTHVRAAPNIRVRYDFDQDGWVVEMEVCWFSEGDEAMEPEDAWRQVGFFQSWELQEKCSHPGCYKHGRKPKDHDRQSGIVPGHPEWIACAKCGNIQNETSDERTCKGPAKVGPR